MSELDDGRIGSGAHPRRLGSDDIFAYASSASRKSWSFSDVAGAGMNPGRQPHNPSHPPGKAMDLVHSFRSGPYPQITDASDIDSGWWPGRIR